MQVIKYFICIRNLSIDVALIKNNAAVGAKIALELAGLESSTFNITKKKEFMPAKVIVVGGTCADVVGKSSKKFDNGSSNIGDVSISVGGVGRNITECLVKLGVRDTMFISIIGKDYHGRLCLEDCEKKGIVTYYCNV